MRNRFIVTAAALGALVSLPAIAADNGIYLGGSIGQSNVEAKDRISDPELDLNEKIRYDSSQTGYKLIGGWRFIDWMSVEANWVDLGSGDDKIGILDENFKTEISVDGWSLSVLGFVPIGPVDLFARVGAFAWDSEAKVKDLVDPGFDFGSTKASDSGTDLTYGIGAQFRVWSLAIRAEYEVFDVSDLDTTDMFSVGVTWTFF